ncbi:uncharacterized protein LOC111596119 [Drosophila hydei]|uniref:Uncharacterized protein LOC111596119 n=1 Tax=Drosophila hydei TaxID=7224 RepID=A0A6J1LMF0_DROHY|nr:uncharacterized protein LOC111596119 [Drosophila hydei]
MRNQQKSPFRSNESRSLKANKQSINMNQVENNKNKKVLDELKTQSKATRSEMIKCKDLTPYDVMRMNNCKTFHFLKSETYPNIRPPVSQCSNAESVNWLLSSIEDYDCGRYFNMENDDVMDVWKKTLDKRTLGCYGVSSANTQREAIEFDKALSKSIKKATAVKPTAVMPGAPPPANIPYSEEVCSPFVLNRQLLQEKLQGMPTIQRKINASEAFRMLYCSSPTERKYPFAHDEPRIPLTTTLDMDRPVPQQKHGIRRKYKYCELQCGIPQNECTDYEWMKYKQDPKAYDKHFKIGTQQMNKPDHEPRDYDELYEQLVSCFEKYDKEDLLCKIYKTCCMPAKDTISETIGGDHTPSRAPQGSRQKINFPAKDLNQEDKRKTGHTTSTDHTDQTGQTGQTGNTGHTGHTRRTSDEKSNKDKSPMLDNSDKETLERDEFEKSHQNKEKLRKQKIKNDKTDDQNLETTTREKRQKTEHKKRDKVNKKVDKKVDKIMDNFEDKKVNKKVNKIDDKNVDKMRNTIEDKTDEDFKSNSSSITKTIDIAPEVPESSKPFQSDTEKPQHKYKPKTEQNRHHKKNKGHPKPHKSINKLNDVTTCKKPSLDCPCEICKFMKRRQTESDSPFISQMKREEKRRQLLEYYRIRCYREQQKCRSHECRAPQHKCDPIVCDTFFCKNPNIAKYCDCLKAMQDLQKLLGPKHNIINNELIFNLEDLRSRICQRLCDCVS